jgi:hypothetical protein
MMMPTGQPLKLPAPGVARWFIFAGAVGAIRRTIARLQLAERLIKRIKSPNGLKKNISRLSPLQKKK